MVEAIVVDGPAVADAPRTSARRRAGGPERLRRTLLLTDSVSIASAWLVASAIAPPWAGTGPGRGLLLLAAVTAASVGTMAAQGLHIARVSCARVTQTSCIARTAAIAGLVAYGLADTTGTPSLAAAVAGGLLTLGSTSLGRGFFDAWLRAARAGDRFVRPVVVVGRGAGIGEVVGLFEHHPELGYRVEGVIGDVAAADAHGLAWLGPVERAADAVRRAEVGGVVVAANACAPRELSLLTRQLRRMGVHVQLASGIRHLDGGRVRVTQMAHEPFLYLEPGSRGRWQPMLKRCLDVTVASASLMVTVPVLWLAAAAIRLEDGGPAVFRQERVGRDGRTFTLFKLRTMCVDAERRLTALATANERCGPLFKAGADPRITRVGRILRATSVDELPQLLNVLRGEMSLVGPRPALPGEVASFDEALLGRHRVRPGITGLWQLEARDNPSFDAYRDLDLFYVENWSCALDLVILAGTIPTVLVRSFLSLTGRDARTTVAA